MSTVFSRTWWESEAKAAWIGLGEAKVIRTLIRFAMPTPARYGLITWAKVVAIARVGRTPGG